MANQSVNVLTFEAVVGMAINKLSNDVKTLVEESGLDEDSIKRFEVEMRRFETLGFLTVAPFEYQAIMRELPKLKEWLAVLRKVIALDPLPRQEVRFSGEENA
jgi:hypothetical protein